MMHVLTIRRPSGPARLDGGYEAVYRDAVIYQGRKPIANSARALLDAKLAAPGDEVLAIRKAAPTRRGEVTALAARLDA